MKEITIGDIIGQKSGVVKINYTKVKEAIRKCEENKLNQQCRRELSDLGVTFVDE